MPRINYNGLAWVLLCAVLVTGAVTHLHWKQEIETRLEAVERIAREEQEVRTSAQSDRIGAAVPEEKNRPDEEFEIFLREGNEYLSHGDFERAKQAFATALSLKPADPEASEGMRNAGEKRALAPKEN